MKIKGYPLVIICLATLLFGAWTSFALFRFLARNVSELPQHKDTVYVQLVNGLPFQRADAADSARRDTANHAAKAVAAINRPPFMANHDSTNRDTDTTLLIQAQPPIRVSNEDITKAAAAARLAQAHFPWWVALLTLCLAAAMTGVIIYGRLPFLAPDLQKDLDPPDLTHLFQEFARQIVSIGNPRKIKRLSNKIRFQYHYMVDRGWKDASVFDGLMRILLTLELKPWLSAPAGTARPDISSEPEFWKYFMPIADSSPIATDSKLAHLIYILNRDPL